MTASGTAGPAADVAPVGKALFATYRGLEVRGDGCLADAHRASELFEFDEAARRHLGAGDLALFRIPVRLNGEPGTQVIGCLVRHADATGRPGFAGGAVAVSDRRLEAIATALPTARRLLDQLLEQGPALAFQEPARRVEGAPRLEHTHERESPVFHVGLPWEACEEPQLVSLLAHCCQHPEFRERTVLIVDRARAGSRPFDWPFFEAIRQALSARPDAQSALTACQSRLAASQATLAQVRADARATAEALAACRAESQAAHAHVDDTDRELAEYRRAYERLRMTLVREQQRAQAARGRAPGRWGLRRNRHLLTAAGLAAALVIGLIAGALLVPVLFKQPQPRVVPAPDTGSEAWIEGQTPDAPAFPPEVTEPIDTPALAPEQGVDAT
jgi:hypothetical protein